MRNGYEYISSHIQNSNDRNATHNNNLAGSLMQNDIRD